MLSVRIKEEDVVIVVCTLNMSKCRLSITLQQLKFKVAKLIQTQHTPFQNVLPEKIMLVLI
jgi:hypothetical protein